MKTYNKDRLSVQCLANASVCCKDSTSSINTIKNLFMFNIKT